MFEEYYEHLQNYDEVAKIPTLSFFYPLKENEEILVRIDPGKKLLIRFMYMSEANEDGMRAVFFKLNGQTRSVEMRDHSALVEKIENRKVSSADHIGSPLQGRLMKIFVEEGETVTKNQPLFSVEAMKMESTITAPRDGVVKEVVLVPKTMVEQNDLIVILGPAKEE